MTTEARRVEAPPGGPAIGDILVEKYRIESVLGVGGMAVVYGAHHVQLDQPCAIKVLLPEVSADAELVERFLREARATAQLRSEHVVRVVDVDTLPSGTPYMVMEWLVGNDLEALLAANGPLQVESAANLLLQVCEALAEAHTHGIVHRDLKPANLFLARLPDGDVSMKVLDFGISKSRPRADDLSNPLTQTIMGTPMYMSPEQLRSSHHVDERADIWSLGVILYELLSGTRLFNGDSVAEICVSVLKEEPVELAEPVDSELLPVILRCLERDANDRYGNVAQLALALAPFASEGAAEITAKISNIFERSHSSSDHALSHVTSVRDIASSPRFRWGKTRKVLQGIRSAAVVMASAMLGVWMGGRACSHEPPRSETAASGVMRPTPTPVPNPGIQLEPLAVAASVHNEGWAAPSMGESSREIDSGIRHRPHPPRKSTPPPSSRTVGLFEDRK